MEKMIKPTQLAKILDVSLPTLRAWDRKGHLIAHRTPGGRRYYLESEVNAWQHGMPIVSVNLSDAQQQPFTINGYDKLEDK